jgi:chromosome segregation ATPase
MDDRLIQRLEESLRDSHATNAELRERLEGADKAQASARSHIAEANVRLQQLERAYAKQKAAEEHSATAQRKQADAERAARELRAEKEKLHARVERLQAEADVLTDLNARIETAKHAADLFS